MSIPNGGLITETNAQYYAGSQQFTISSTGVGQTFTSTFEKSLTFGNSDPSNNNYLLNNFKIFTSPDANVWTELTPTATATTGAALAAAGSNVTGQKVVSINPGNNNILAGMSVFNGTTLIGVIQTVNSNANFTCVSNLTANVTNATVLTFRFASPWTEANNIVTINSSLTAGNYLKIQLNEDALWDLHGNYEYTKLEDVINNFLIAYVGPGKLLNSVNRSNVIFHAKRGLQEFSYDTLRSIIIPQDYVNYTRISCVDDQGVQKTIYPANLLTLRPYANPIQDDKGVPTQDSQFSNLEGTSKTTERWDSNNPRNISGAYINDYEVANVYWRNYYDGALGQRYGLNPETSQRNGWFIIDDRKGLFAFSNNLKDKLIILEYISDGNAYGEDLKIPKLAEEALYAHILYSILSTNVGVQEYIVQRFKKERSAKLRNAKIRLSNIKLEEIVQVMRNKSKWIKY